MADEELGDVIILDSSDEGPSKPKKRPLKGNHISDSLNRAPKRPKKQKPGSGSQKSTQGSSSEEGEINEDDSQGRAKQKDSRGSKSDASPQASQESSVSSGKISTIKDLSGAYVPPDAPLFPHNSISYRLPLFPRKREGAWDERFETWTRVFYAHNATYASSMDAMTVQAAYVYYIDVLSGLKGKKKRSAKQAAVDAFEKGTLEQILQSLAPSAAQMIIDFPPPSQKSSGQEPVPAPAPSGVVEVPTTTTEAGSTGQDGGQNSQKGPSALNGSLDVPKPAEANSDQNDVTSQSTTNENGRVASSDQLKYFPSASDPSKMCLLCGGEGHAAASCLSSVCKFCNSTEHWHYCCPTRARCNKCRQQGHSAQSCTEKLALTRDEGLACGFCNQRDHVEDDCLEVWRSFHPHAQSNNLVVHLPVSCCNCGSPDHYVGDCDDGRPRGPMNQTWTSANYNRYVDSKSDSSPINLAAMSVDGHGRPTRAPEIRIRGHAARTGNIVHYSDSDSEVEFLGKKPVKKAGVQPIRMSSNIMMPGDGSRPKGNAGPPPLPPGPPPRAPPRQLPSGFSRLRGAPTGPSSLPPPPGLPAKPPPSAFDGMPPSMPARPSGRPGKRHRKGRNRPKGPPKGP